MVKFLFNFWYLFNFENLLAEFFFFLIGQVSQETAFKCFVLAPKLIK